MAKAFVETTILTEVLLKSNSPIGKAAAALLRRYGRTEIPEYAIKEFTNGPLANMAWMHNKLASTRSYWSALDALHKMSLTPRRHTTATAIEALREAARSTARSQPRDLVAADGTPANLDVVLCDQYRLALKAYILKAWKRRRTAVGPVVLPLPCYTEADPYEENGLLIVAPRHCNPEIECGLASGLKSRPNDLIALKTAVDKQPAKRENRLRSQALRALIRTPRRAMTERHCRDLGDAIFAFFAPQDATVLTTNERDLRPLCESLGKKVERP